MARWLEIVLTLVLFAATMSAVGWVVNATVPGAVDWIADRLGNTVTLAILAAFGIAAALYGYLDHRRAGTRPKGM